MKTKISLRFIAFGAVVFAALGALSLMAPRGGGGGRGGGGFHGGGFHGGGRSGFHGGSVHHEAVHRVGPAGHRAGPAQHRAGPAHHPAGKHHAGHPGDRRYNHWHEHGYFAHRFDPFFYPFFFNGLYWGWPWWLWGWGGPGIALTLGFLYDRDEPEYNEPVYVENDDAADNVELLYEDLLEAKREGNTAKVKRLRNKIKSLVRTAPARPATAEE